MPARSKTSPEEILAAFHTQETLKSVARRLGVSPNRLRGMWKESYGAEAFDARSKLFVKGATDEAYRAAEGAFASDEPFKKVAARLGMSPNTLRKLWVGRYGQDLFDARSKKSQAEGAVAHGSRLLGVLKKRTYAETICEGCGAILTLSRGQLARLSKVLCNPCRGKVEVCPVCSILCESQRGLARHLSLAKDEPHVHLLQRQEEEKWSGLQKGWDYIECLECRLRVTSLTNHLKTHSLTIKEYRVRYPGAPSICGRVLEHKKVNTRSFSYDLTAEDLLKFADTLGRVVVEAVCQHYACTGSTVLRYCRMYGLPSRNKLAWQKAVLDQASSYLGQPYEWEWSDSRIVNPDSGRVLNYDGFFPHNGLIIEAHGDQHFIYSEKWHGSRRQFEKSKERDAFKKRMAESLGYAFKTVRPTDPIYDTSFWGALLGGDQVLWENKPSEDKERLTREVLGALRRQGWPEVPPCRVVKAELVKLSETTVYVDSDRNVRPHSVRGTSACASFFPNRYEARHLQSKVSVREAWDDDDLLLKAIRLQLDSGHPTTPERTRKALIFYCRCPSVFRPAVAKYVYETYCPKGGVVWDPCAGYGGRLMGAMAAGVSYIGCDIEPRTVDGNRELAEALGLAPRCQITRARAELFDPGEVDLVFTSPPYFNLEGYGPASIEASREYGTSEGWVGKFLMPVMKRAWDRLRPGGYLILNLPSKSVQACRLDRRADDVGRALGFLSENPVFLPLRRMKSAVVRREPILVWRRP